jgi:hypothetical protein
VKNHQMCVLPYRLLHRLPAPISCLRESLLWQSAVQRRKKEWASRHTLRILQHGTEANKTGIEEELMHSEKVLILPKDNIGGSKGTHSVGAATYIAFSVGVSFRES